MRKPISKLTKLELDEWAHKLAHDNNMTKTDYINVSSLVRQPLDYAVEQGIIDENLLRRVKLEPRMFKPVRKKSSETQVFTKEELAKLKQIAWDDLDKPHPFELRLELCLHMFYEFSYKHSWIADTIVPWAQEWLYYYEVWLATGEWCGGGHTPVSQEQ